MRNTGGDFFKIIGMTQVSVLTTGTHRYVIPEQDRYDVMPGDLLMVMIPGTGGVVKFTTELSCPDNHKLRNGIINTLADVDDTVNLGVWTNCRKYQMTANIVHQTTSQYQS